MYEEGWDFDIAAATKKLADFSSGLADPFASADKPFSETSGISKHALDSQSFRSEAAKGDILTGEDLAKTANPAKRQMGLEEPLAKPLLKIAKTTSDQTSNHTEALPFLAFAGHNSEDLPFWLAMVKEERTPEAVLSILARFRIMPWSDEERAQMSRCYVPILERFYEVIL